MELRRTAIESPRGCFATAVGQHAVRAVLPLLRIVRAGSRDTLPSQLELQSIMGAL
jgi:hypothetical protein